MIRRLSFALMGLLCCAPATVCAQTAPRHKRATTKKTAARTSPSASVRHLAQVAPTHAKQAARNLAETYAWYLNYARLMYKGTSAIYQHMQLPDGFFHDEIVYQFPTSVELYLQEQGGISGTIPHVAPILLSNGYAVAFIALEPLVTDQATGMGGFKHTGYDMVILESPKRPRRLYFTQNDITHTMLTLTEYKVKEFFHDPYLFTPGTTSEVYTKRYDALEATLSTPPDNVNVEDTRGPTRQAMRTWIANTLNDLIYNRNLSLFTDHPTVKQTPLSPQIIVLYKHLRLNAKTLPDPLSDETYLAEQRMLNREILFYLLPHELFNPDLFPSPIAYTQTVPNTVRRAGEDRGDLVLYDANDQEIARYDLTKNW